MKNKKGLILLSIALLLSACTTPPARSFFPSKEPTGNSWKEIFDQPQDGLKVEIWNTGQINVPLSGLLNIKHDNAPKFETKKRYVDIPVYLISSKNNGTFLIDAGLDTAFKDNRFKYITGLVSRFVIPKGKQEPGQSIKERLNAQNITLSAIFFTHLHFDHIAGLVDIDLTFPLIVGENEKAVDIPLLFHTRHLDKVTEILELDFSKSKSLYPFKQVLDVFNDNSVFAINTGGHSKGHVSYLINGVGGPYLITGDQVNIKENISSGVGPGSYSENTSLAQEYFDQIMEFKALYPKTKLYLGHDIHKN